MSDLQEVRDCDDSDDEQYPTSAKCGTDYDAEIVDGGADVGIRVAFSCAEHGLHGVTGPFESMTRVLDAPSPRTPRST